MPAPAPGPSSAELSQITVSSRIPEFWTDAPRLWFVQFEAVLANQKLGDEAKYHLVITKMAKDTIQQVTDLLLQPPCKEKYTVLKERLLAVYEESENRQIQKLIGEMDLGDQKPSQLLRRMRDLARGKIPDDTLRILWQGHLPPAARAVLAVTDMQDLESLANVADKVLETTRSAQVNEVAQISSDKILDEIAKIGRRLEALERSRPRQRQFGRNRSYSRGRNQTHRSPSKNKQKLCFYHARFKTRAHKCVKPCAWVVPDGEGN